MGSSSHPGTMGCQQLLHFQGQRLRPCLPPGSPPESLHSRCSSGMSLRNSGSVLGPGTCRQQLPLNGKFLAAPKCLSQETCNSRPPPLP